MNTIMIVDDTPENLQVLETMLKQVGYKVRPAPNGAIALKSAQAVPPDLILLDVLMPGLDGYDVCRQLQSDERTRPANKDGEGRDMSRPSPIPVSSIASKVEKICMGST